MQQGEQRLLSARERLCKMCERDETLFVQRRQAVCGTLDDYEPWKHIVECLNSFGQGLAVIAGWILGATKEKFACISISPLHKNRTALRADGLSGVYVRK